MDQGQRDDDWDICDCDADVITIMRTLQQQYWIEHDLTQLCAIVNMYRSFRARINGAPKISLADLLVDATANGYDSLRAALYEQYWASKDPSLVSGIIILWNKLPRSDYDALDAYGKG
jgi:hypothetical protein